MLRFQLEYRELVQNLIDNYQTDFPIVSNPFALIAESLNTSEPFVMETLSQMLKDELIGRVGPIYQTHRVGYSLLAACSCDNSDILKISNIINSFQEVNHNYERENKLNIWFVVTAKDESRVYEVCKEIESLCELKVLCFPMVKPYKIDLSLKEKIDWDLL